MKKLALHWQILLGMAFGIIAGIIAIQIGTDNTKLESQGSLEGIITLVEADGLDLDFKVQNETKGREDGKIEVIIKNGVSPYVYNWEGKADQTTNTIAGLKPGNYRLSVNDQAGKSQQAEISIQKANYTGKHFVVDWIKPFGRIFINLLKLIAIPLIVASLIKGVSDLQDISKLSKMGGRTIGIYLVTTVIAVTIGLALVNIVAPGNSISEETRTELLESFKDDAEKRKDQATAQKNAGPLQPLVDMVPDNIVGAASSNGNMLQVIFFVVFFGIGLILIPNEKAKPVKDFFDGLNEVILKLIDLIMLSAPIGVFALLAALVAESPSAEIFAALIKYSLTVVAGLSIMIFVVYPLLVRRFTGFNIPTFFRGIAPAQLLAFSTSSSAATLPVTMERVEEHLGVDSTVTSFVLPIGATINMDGTSLYQAVAAVFIAQVMGIDLTIGDQLTIVLTATLASIGSAAVPGAGMVMLVIVLGAIGVPEAGLALIFAVDRPLDMCRTVVNVTGDASVSMIVAKSVNKLGDPHVREWDDNYPKSA